MIGVTAFVHKVREIAKRPLIYKTGGVGKNSACDCIGLIMGAMYELGQKPYDMHSTNYFARYQTLELKRVNEKELFVGQLLYRARESTAKLHERYQQGGRYYTGDLLDYYHVGVVTRLAPLEITECTEYGKVTGIVISNRLDNWHYAGKLRGVLYEDYTEDYPMYEEAKGLLTVNTQSGALNIREFPDTGTVLGKAPKGATLELLGDDGSSWLKVRYGDTVGYASAQYLVPQAENVVEVSGGEKVVIVDSAGNRFEPVGGWTVFFGSVD